MKFKIILICLALFLVAIAIVSAESLKCSIKTTCSANEASVIDMSSTTNAHAELPGTGNYGYKACCSIPGFTVGSSCTEGVNFLKLSSNTNAHVEKTSYSNYNGLACISGPTNGEMSCEYVTNSNCAEGYSCIGSISGDTNAQINDCTTNPYPIRVCCKCTATASGTVRDVNGNPVNGANIKFLEGTESKQDTTTDINGNYQIEGVLCGKYEVIVSKPGYISSAKGEVLVPATDSTTLDFEEESALVPGTSCEDDCTYAGDNIVHKECDGIDNGIADLDGDGKTSCEFYDNIAKNVCDLAKPGWIRNYDENSVIECAEGSPNEKVSTQAKVKCEEGNLIKNTKVVTYKGKLMKLVIAMCG
jgi:hypothetical protein